MKDCFKARKQTFELKRTTPKGKRKPANGQGSVTLPYNGRVSDCPYVPGERIHFSYVSEVKIRTGPSYMPEQLVGYPTLTVSTNAAEWWWLNLGVPPRASVGNAGCSLRELLDDHRCQSRCRRENTRVCERWNLR